MSRLQLIIERLEAKIKPMSLEIQTLKEKLEIAVLDKECAEEDAHILRAKLKEAQLKLDQLKTQLEMGDQNIQMLETLSEENLGLNTQVQDLKNQLQELETLEDLNNELQSTHFKRETELENQLKQANQQLKMCKIELKQWQSRASSPTPTTKDPPQRGLEELKLKLHISQLESQALQLELDAEKNGFFKVLQQHAGTDLSLFKYRLAVAGEKSHNEAVQTLFKKFVRGYVSQKTVLETIESIHAELESKAPTYNAKASIEYLQDLNPDVGFNEYIHNCYHIDKTLVESATNDPKNQAVVASILSALQTPPRDSGQVRELLETIKSKDTQLDVLKLQLAVLESKLGSAEDLLRKVTQLENALGVKEAFASQLQDELSNSKRELQATQNELERLQLVSLPADLETAVALLKNRRLHSTIAHLGLLQSQTIEPLAPLPRFKKKVLSKLCGNPNVHKLLDARFEIKVPGSTKRMDQPKWAALEQARILSVVDCPTSFVGEVPARQAGASVRS